MANKPDLPLGIYRHYKGQNYQVLGLARHSESLEWLVLYKPLYGDSGLWVRPAEMFMGEVEVDGIMQERFEFLSTEETQ